MRLQADGKRILLLPAWPKDWDADFKLRAPLQTADIQISSIDDLIVGTARPNGWTMVTGNLGEFRRVKNLKAESWLE